MRDSRARLAASRSGAPLVALTTASVALVAVVGMLPGTGPAAATSSATGAEVSNPASPAPDPSAPTPTCLTSVPTVKANYLAKVPAKTRQLIVVRGISKRSYDSKFERWQKVGSCWVRVSSDWSLNGAKGWHARPWTGSLRSPIGVFSLTDTGGRLPNPGTTMHYHYGPQRYERGGYKISYPVQLYNYVIAINYNRRIGKHPRDTRQPDPTTGSGYWIHQRGLGVTRGCVSLPKKKLRRTLQWLSKADRPYVVMGPQKLIGAGPRLSPPVDW
ncbi:MAG: L,D-transpeptidase family protein [Candidatus Nanopelagicales bacterium]